jgi:hypothetical protein
MKVYWKIESMPELQGFSTAEARSIWQHHNIRSLKDPWFYVALVPAAVLGPLCRGLACDQWSDRTICMSALVVGAAIGGGLFGFVAMLLTRRRIRRSRETSPV